MFAICTVACCLTILWTSLAGAQRVADSSRFVVSGVVVDSITGEPLEGVSVHIVGTTLGSHTSRTGGFSIHGTVLKRPWRLMIRRLCYETVEIPFALRAAEDSLRVPRIRLARRTNVEPPGSVMFDCTHMRDFDAAAPETLTAPPTPAAHRS